MKTRSVAHVALHISAVLDSVEHDGEEILLVRNRRPEARLIPEDRQNAMQVFGDLYCAIDDETADALSAAVAVTRKSRRGRLRELRGLIDRLSASGIR